MARDVQQPESTGMIRLPDTTGPGDPGELPPEDRNVPNVPKARPGAYWTGLVVLVAGLAVTVAVLATRVTSIVQTILLAVPLALIGIGL
ncbi:MAG TPA: hypothetical protein VFS70_16780, partial [Actinomycetota bacterium]|nr:hypothetical protein [Actinomycetota bacterium]